MIYQINPFIKEIIININSDKIHSLDYATIGFYKLKIINELDRLFTFLHMAPEESQKAISDSIHKLEHSIDILDSINPKMSNINTLMTKKF